jgi:hypothetical protein
MAAGWFEPPGPRTAELPNDTNDANDTNRALLLLTACRICVIRVIRVIRQFRLSVAPPLDLSRNSRMNPFLPQTTRSTAEVCSLYLCGPPRPLRQRWRPMDTVRWVVTSSQRVVTAARRFVTTSLSFPIPVTNVAIRAERSIPGALLRSS